MEIHRNPAAARSPAMARKPRKSPSTLKRNARRRELFLKKKSETPSSIPSSQKETTHPQSQSHCHPSADSIDIDNIVVHQNMGNGNWISHQPIHSPIHQSDGTRDPCDEVDDHSQLNDTNITNGDDHPEILCIMCNVKMTPTHQCSDFGKTPVKRKDIDAWLESWRLRMAK